MLHDFGDAMKLSVGKFRNEVDVGNGGKVSDDIFPCELLALGEVRLLAFVDHGDLPLELVALSENVDRCNLGGDQLLGILALVRELNQGDDAFEQLFEQVRQGLVINLAHVGEASLSVDLQGLDGFLRLAFSGAALVVLVGGLGDGLPVEDLLQPTPGHRADADHRKHRLNLGGLEKWSEGSLDLGDLLVGDIHQAASVCSLLEEGSHLDGASSKIMSHEDHRLRIEQDGKIAQEFVVFLVGRAEDALVEDPGAEDCWESRSCGVDAVREDLVLSADREWRRQAFQKLVVNIDGATSLFVNVLAAPFPDQGRGELLVAIHKEDIGGAVLQLSCFRCEHVGVGVVEGTLESCGSRAGGHCRTCAQVEFKLPLEQANLGRFLGCQVMLRRQVQFAV